MAYVYALQSSSILAPTPSRLRKDLVEPGFIPIQQGQRFRADDPIVKANGWLFTEDATEVLEEATARPGEKRATRRA